MFIPQSPLPVLSQFALKSEVPVPAGEIPLTEAPGGDPGVEGMAVSGARHRHPRLTSATAIHTLDGNGKLYVAFTRTFTQPPSITVFRLTTNQLQLAAGATEPTSTQVTAVAKERPVDFQGTLVQNAEGLYIGIIVTGQRQALLPSLSQLTGITLLSALLTGVNTISSTLTGFDVFGAPASGVKFTLIAVANSAPAA